MQGGDLKQLIMTSLFLALAGCSGGARETHSPPTVEDWIAFDYCVHGQVQNMLIKEPDRDDLNIATLAVGRCFGPIEEKIIMSSPWREGTEKAAQREEMLRLETAFKVQAERKKLAPQ